MRPEIAATEGRHGRGDTGITACAQPATSPDRPGLATLRSGRASPPCYDLLDLRASIRVDDERVALTCPAIGPAAGQPL